ncbi:hypothetical protein, partial [Paenibacillus sp. y28]|uniref:hypothetical protein n=1 Tax=Paenibacillus sp. y28 TaxID=3129110 RepID=UPI00301AEDD1
MFIKCNITLGKIALLPLELLRNQALVYRKANLQGTAIQPAAPGDNILAKKEASIPLNEMRLFELTGLWPKLVCWKAAYQIEVWKLLRLRGMRDKQSTRPHSACASFALHEARSTKWAVFS